MSRRITTLTITKMAVMAMAEEEDNFESQGNDDYDYIVGDRGDADNCVNMGCQEQSPVCC